MTKELSRRYIYCVRLAVYGHPRKKAGIVENVKIKIFHR